MSAQLWKRLAKQLRVSARLGGQLSKQWHERWKAAEKRLDEQNAVMEGLGVSWARYRKEMDALTNERDALKLAVETLLTHPVERLPHAWSGLSAMVKALAQRIGRQRLANRQLQRAYDSMTQSFNASYRQCAELRDQLRVALDALDGTERELKEAAEEP